MKWNTNRPIWKLSVQVVGGRVSALFRSSRAMGDRSLCNQPPGIAWNAYSDSALLQTIQNITQELQKRVPVRIVADPAVVVSTSVASVPGVRTWTVRDDTGATGYHAQTLEK